MFTTETMAISMKDPCLDYYLISAKKLKTKKIITAPNTLREYIRHSMLSM